jgi:hypothetical protein
LAATLAGGLRPDPLGPEGPEGTEGTFEGCQAGPIMR